MFDDKMDNLFSQFDRHEERMRQRIRKVNAVYIERAMHTHKEEMRIFVETLIADTGIVLPRENNNEA